MRKEKLVIGTVLALVVGCAAGSSAPGSSNRVGEDGGGIGSGSAGEDGSAGTVAASGDDGGGFGNVLPEAGLPGNGGGDGGSGGGGNSGGGGDSGGAGDNGSNPPDGGTTFVVATPISGTPSPTTLPLHGPGLVLMGGGTDVDGAFVWMHDTLAGSSSAKMGNVIVFNTQTAPPTIDNDYTSYIFGVAPFQSVQTLYLGGYKNDGNSAPEATATDVAIAAWYVGQADAVFFAGGDQADYVYWYKTSPSLMAALTALYQRGGVIGGTSAGCSIMGSYVFDDLAADDLGTDPATADVIKNPYESSVSFTRNMLSFASLPNVFADPHFVTRDRFGRLAGSWRASMPMETRQRAWLASASTSQMRLSWTNPGSRICTSSRVEPKTRPGRERTSSSRRSGYDVLVWKAASLQRYQGDAAFDARRDLRLFEGVRLRRAVHDRSRWIEDLALLSFAVHDDRDCEHLPVTRARSSRAQGAPRGGHRTLSGAISTRFRRRRIRRRGRGWPVVRGGALGIYSTALARWRAR